MLPGIAGKDRVRNLHQTEELEARKRNDEGPFQRRLFLKHSQRISVGYRISAEIRKAIHAIAFLQSINRLLPVKK